MKTPVPQFASGVRYTAVRAVKCCAISRRRSHSALILEILAISEREEATAPTHVVPVTSLAPPHFLNRSQLTPYQFNFVELLPELLPPCSHGGPIEAGLDTFKVGPNCCSFRRVHTAAPLKLGPAPFGQVQLSPFRRVHTAAPLKLPSLQVEAAAVGALPPCSHGGPIEAFQRGARELRFTTFRRVHTAAPLKLMCCLWVIRPWFPSAVFTRRPH